MRQIIILLLLISFNLYGFSQDTCQFVIRVKNIKEIKGSLKYAVYDHNDKFLKEAAVSGGAAIDSSAMTFVVEGLQSGGYAVSIFHDKDDDGELNTNFIGIPTEPYAFSNNAKGRFGPPNFEDCLFELTKTTQILIEL